MAYKLMTENKYSLLDCASSLQKTIRRGLEEEAMFWAAELETRFHDYLWVRLTAIAHEDIVESCFQHRPMGANEPARRDRAAPCQNKQKQRGKARIPPMA